MKELYFEFLNVENEESVIEKFHDTLVDTNRSYLITPYGDWRRMKEMVK